MKTWQRAVIAFSLANLCFIRTWSELLDYSPADTFYMAAPPSRAQYAAVMADVALLALLLFAAATLAHRLGGWLSKTARWSFFCMLLVPLNGVREIIFAHSLGFGEVVFRIASPSVLGLVLAVSAVLLFIFVIRRQRGLVSNLARILLLISPLALLTTCRAGLDIVRARQSQLHGRSLAHMLPDSPGRPRVVFLIFDEWDYRLTFEGRLPGLSLPQLDSLRETALFATQAHTPASTTTVSIPSILTGRLATTSWAEDASDLLLQLAGESRATELSRLPNIFSQARTLGLNTAVVGWCLPYCRILSEDLTSCAWWEIPRQFNSTGTTFVANAINEPRSWFEAPLFSVFGQSLVQVRSSEVYRQELEKARQVVTDSGTGLALVHFGLPHPPYFYNRKTRSFDLKNTAVTGYWDGLALVDRTVGELRQAMEVTGVWDRTVVLITSDHAFRTRRLDGKRDSRVPFFLKLAGQRQGLQFAVPFNNLLIHDLIGEILQRHMTTAEQTAAWISAAAERQPPALRQDRRTGFDRAAE